MWQSGRAGLELGCGSGESSAEGTTSTEDATTPTTASGINLVSDAMDDEAFEESNSTSVVAAQLIRAAKHIFELYGNFGNFGDYILHACSTYGFRRYYFNDEPTYK